MPKSLNKVLLIGNVTRDPELRHTKNGTPVCGFELATNRSGAAENGEKKEETEFHNIIAWGKLADVCRQYLAKGRRVYVEGKLTTRTWQTDTGEQKSRTEVVIEDMIMLDNKGQATQKRTQKAKEDRKGAGEEQSLIGRSDEEVSPEEIPF